MRIDVRSVSVKNFLSYGNAENTYTFEKGIDIIIAPNGADSNPQSSKKTNVNNIKNGICR